MVVKFALWRSECSPRSQSSIQRLRSLLCDFPQISTLDTFLPAWHQTRSRVWDQVPLLCRLLCAEPGLGLSHVRAAGLGFRGLSASTSWILALGVSGRAPAAVISENLISYYARFCSVLWYSVPLYSILSDYIHTVV